VARLTRELSAVRSPQAATCGFALPMTDSGQLVIAGWQTAWLLRARTEGDQMQLVASIGLIVIGLVIVNADDSASDMRVYGWILVAVGVFGLFLGFVVSRIGQNRRGRPGPPPQ